MKQTDLRIGMVVAVKGGGYRYDNPQYSKYDKARVLSVGTGSGPRHRIEYVEEGAHPKGYTGEVSSKFILGPWGGAYEEKWQEQYAVRDKKNKEQFAEEFKMEMMNDRVQEIIPHLVVFGGLEAYEEEIVVYNMARKMYGKVDIEEPWIKVPLGALEILLTRLRESYQAPWS